MIRLLLLTGTLLVLVSCITSEVTKIRPDVVQDNKYDTEHPTSPMGDELKSIVETVKLVSSLTFYKQYYLKAEQNITIDYLNYGLALNERDAIIMEKPTSGTATIIYADIDKIALLTCAHTITSPDTIIYYFLGDDGKPTEYIESVSIKVRQSLNIVGLPRGDRITVLAVDEASDLAIVGKELTKDPHFTPRAFSFPIGVAEELEWGTFAYLIGFPHGKKMITSTIVSNPNPGKKNNFIINATMYRGVSGGIILALRDGVPNFELIGMANALSAHQNIKIKPDPLLNIDTINPVQPYTGDIFLGRSFEIVDGITFAIPAETIKKFLNTHRSNLAAMGYYIELY